jgi:UDP-N-acetylglucosamine:LPS N-acetylglucosamine transferase
VEEVMQLIESPESLEKMAAAAKAFAKPGAARRAADVLESVASGPKGSDAIDTR